VKHLRGLSGPTPTKSEAIAILRDRLADGTITPVIDSTFPLSDVRAAFRRMMGGEAVRKVILTPSPTASR